MKVQERFLKYVSIDTQSDPSSPQFPSTPTQIPFADMLAQEMKAMGLSQVERDSNGYVYGHLPATGSAHSSSGLAFLAHMDVSPDAPAAPVKTRIVTSYDGGDILLNPEKKIFLSPADYPVLGQYQGQDLIVTDGTTLLGGDDKAGIAEILTAAEYLLQHPKIPHGPITLCFTPDEEVGRGVDHIDLSRIPAAFAYTVDGGELGEIEYENFNAASAVVQVQGLSIHPGSAKGKMRNASTLAMEYHSLLPKDQSPEYTEGYEGFFHLTDMKGCVESAVLEYIIRDHSRELFEQRKQLMQTAADTLNSKYGPGTIQLSIQDSYYNMKEKIEPHMHLIENVLKVYEKLGVTPKIQPIRGGTDGARLSFMGLPCPNLGTGDHNCHGRFEFVCIQSMEKMVEVIVELCQLY